MRTEARFPEIPAKAGHYESFYLKLVQPGGGRSAWIRHTVHKRPGEEVKLFALLQKHTTSDPSTLPAEEALAIARGRRSDLLGGTPIVVGQPADFLLMRSSDPELSAGDLDADLVYAAGGSVVDTTVVAGEILMQDRQVADADEIVAEVRARARRLTGL